MRLSLPTRTIQVLCGLVLLALGTPLSARTLSQTKQLALKQFQKAEQMREELNGRPMQGRTRRDYQRVMDAYRRVYYMAPTSVKADDSIVAVADLLAETGRRFNEPGTLRAAIGQYEFLRSQYPGSKYRVNALFTIGEIYKSDLNDSAQAKATFEEFLKHYPRSPLAEKVRAALAELEQPPERAENRKKEPEAHETAATLKGTPLSLVTGIRYWSTPDYTRIAIDLGSEVQYQAGRVPHPARIFFDLYRTRLSSTLVGKSFDVQDGLLRKIRVAQFARGITRVVLDVDNLSDYSAFLLPNPYRLIIDIHGRQTGTTLARDKGGTEKSLKPDLATDLATNKEASDEGARDTKRPPQPSNFADSLALQRSKVADGTTAPLKPELEDLARSAAHTGAGPSNSEPPTVRKQRAAASPASRAKSEARIADRRSVSTGTEKQAQATKLALKGAANHETTPGSGQANAKPKGEQPEQALAAPAAKLSPRRRKRTRPLFPRKAPRPLPATRTSPTRLCWRIWSRRT